MIKFDDYNCATIVGIDPNTKTIGITGLNKLGRVVFSGVYDLDPERLLISLYNLLLDISLQYNVKGNFLVETQRHRKMSIVEGAIQMAIVSLWGVEPTPIHPRTYKSYFGLETGSRKGNKELVLELWKKEMELQFGEYYYKKFPINARTHDMCDSYFMARWFLHCRQ